MAVFISCLKNSEILNSDSLSSFILMYHRVCKINKVIMEARSMDKKKVIKFMINVLPIVLVPLIVERKRIKQHATYKKLQMLQVKLLQKHLQQSVTQRVMLKNMSAIEKNKILKINVNLKSLLENMILPILRKKAKN